MTSLARDELLVQLLAPGGAEPVVVADFQPFSADPPLSQLLSGRTEGRPLYRIDPVNVLSQDQGYFTLPDLAAACADAFLRTASAAGRVFVIGDCSAAGLALRIAELLAASRAVTALLVRPTWPDEQHIKAQFAAFQANLGAGSHECPDLDEDPRLSLARMEEILRGELARMAASIGLASTDAFGDLLTYYRGWLAFLLACCNDRPVAPAAGKATVKVVAPGAVAGAAIPGLSPHAYQIIRIPAADQQDAAQVAIADFVLTQIAAGGA